MAASKTRISFLVILGALMSITSLSTDIYLPALPTMEAALGGDSELTITGFLIGFSLAQLLWGPISDRIGRKIPLSIGIILFIIGSIGCATSTSMTMVVFWRVFQALGACVGPMLSRAMIRDSYGVTEAARTLSTLAMIMAVAPIAGPLLGGALLTTGTWKLIFWVMAGAGVIFFGTIFLLPETLPPASRTHQLLWETFANYWTLLKTRTFMRYVLCVTAFYVAAYAFITGSPKVYITYFGVPEQYYGLFFGCNIIGLTLVSALNRRLVMSYTMDTLLRRSLGGGPNDIFHHRHWWSVGNSHPHVRHVQHERDHRLLHQCCRPECGATHNDWGSGRALGVAAIRQRHCLVAPAGAVCLRHTIRHDQHHHILCGAVRPLHGGEHRSSCPTGSAGRRQALIYAMRVN